MFVVFNFILINTVLVVLVSAYAVSSQNESAYIPADDGEELLYANNEKHTSTIEEGNTAKHVFYWLYTRDHEVGQLLNRSEPHMIESTTYDSKNLIKLVVHGWLGYSSVNDSICPYVVNGYLRVGEYNVICVDWEEYAADMTYATAKIRAKHIAKDIAKVLTRITYNMTEAVDSIHLIGHSMGAHIVGFVGKILTNQIPRITGLDPAKPLYANSDPVDRIDKTDGKFVDIIHTNGKKNGIYDPLGDIDFYPNGGKRQPNCNISVTGSCNHAKSYHYFAQSIWAKEDFVATNCTSWRDYLKGRCNNSDTTYMGEYVDKNQTGKYYLKTPVDLEYQ
ncbi:Triacylglycerol lipase family,Lipase/vitellogenin,Lipase, N-terminal,Alpha/Beta [Cinara cedri]|uniref:Triacylglycerol lipase family,Lipase/vitellogenin,Lipase, N-terminal,Alpha/Beta n=1 Tax=Cinara cedri TaxID=506608 RepID=A0A5E4NF44_9HEMI|nr:Triacylglycerol lipase family,Lipase/vitellogenin,Lipase, N-terminal,Alpha/Beta [Cinara cedri]